MGAVFYETIQIVKGNNVDAFRLAKQEASEENGHQDGYSGDIQTCDTLKKAKDYPRYGTTKFNSWLEEKNISMQKGDCEWLEITGKNAIELKKRRGFGGKRGYKVFYFFGVGSV